MGWSNVPEGTLITGLVRNGSADSGAHGLHHIKAATYVNSVYNTSENCTEENWWGVWDTENQWVLCPAGNAIRGLYRNADNHLGESKLHHIEEGR